MWHLPMKATDSIFLSGKPSDLRLKRLLDYSDYSNFTVGCLLHSSDKIKVIIKLITGVNDILCLSKEMMLNL